MTPTDGEGQPAQPPPVFQRIETPSAELEEIYGRVEKGIAWLIEHDPHGAFHWWFKSKISPLAAMPAKTDEQRAAYAAYHQARTLFERLWRKMVALEKVEVKR